MFVSMAFRVTFAAALLKGRVLSLNTPFDPHEFLFRGGAGPNKPSSWNGC